MDDNGHPPPGDAEYRRICTEYFIAGYKKRVARLGEDLKPYKVPSGEMFNDGVLPYLMADTSFFLALTPYSVKKPIATQEAPFTHGADMIWEACGLHAEEWMNILMILTHSTSRTSEEVVAWLTSGYDTFPYCFRTKPTFDSVTDHFEELAKYGDPGPKMILRQIHQRLETLHSNFNGTNLAKYWSHDFWNSTPPLATGLNEYVQSRMIPLREHYIKPSLVWLSPETPPDAPTSKPISLNAPILFGAAGTGKTRRILDMLTGTLGMYAIAPGLNPYDEGRDVIQPSYSGASRDTWSLWQDMTQLEPITKSHFFEHQTAQMVDSLIWSREDLLLDFVQHHEGRLLTSTREHWRRLQITCTEDCDPFDACWRLFRLIRYCGSETIPATIADLIWCIDESQVSCEEELGKKLLTMLWHSLGCMRPCILSGTALRLLEIQEIALEYQPDPEFDGAAAGMAVFKPVAVAVDSDYPVIDNARSFWKLFQTHLEGIINESSNRDQAEENPGTSKSFSSLKTRAGRALSFVVDSSHQTLVARILHMASSEKVIHPVLALSRAEMDLQCRWFFGRYRWTTLLIEHFLKAAIENPEQLGKPLVISAAQEARKVILEAFRKQLRRTQDQPWIEKLYKMAIRADVFSQPSILQDKTAQLVSEGFALVAPVAPVQVPTDPTHHRRESGDDNDTADLDPTPDANIQPAAKAHPKEQNKSDQYVKSWLCEASSVDAVMSHLRTSEKYDAIMDDFFSLLQIDNADQGAIGKVAEYIFASKLDNFLSREHIDAQPCNNVGASRRMNFFEILAQARRGESVVKQQKVTRADHKGKGIDLRVGRVNRRYDDFYLYKCEEQPARLNASRLTNQTGSFDTWLGQIWGGESSAHSTFLFPDKMEGPDLMFVLTNGQERVLCVVQFKVTKSGHQPAKIKQVLDKLTQGNWIKARTEGFDAGVVFIYAAPHSQINEDDFEKAVEARVKKLKRRNCPIENLSFCYTDKNDAAEVWGHTLDRSIELMKTKAEEGQTESDSHDGGGGGDEEDDEEGDEGFDGGDDEG